MSGESIKLFENLARRTWRHLAAAHQLKISMSETTFTDNNLLDIRIANLPNVRVYKALGRDEPEKGFDWEWWIGRQGVGWWRYSVQAKKLDLKSGSYKDLRHPVGNDFQIAILDDFARVQGSIPLYCFYNHLSDAAAKKHWNCSLPLDAEQLGCSVVPLDVVREYHDLRMLKSFERIHNSPMAVPWRCLLRCPRLNWLPTAGSTGKTAENHPLAGDRRAILVRELPVFLVQQDNVQEGMRMDNAIYESRLGGYPKRIMVVDLGAD